MLPVVVNLRRAVAVIRPSHHAHSANAASLNSMNVYAPASSLSGACNRQLYYKYVI